MKKDKSKEYVASRQKKIVLIVILAIIAVVSAIIVVYPFVPAIKYYFSPPNDNLASEETSPSPKELTPPNRLPGDSIEESVIVEPEEPEESDNTPSLPQEQAPVINPAINQLIIPKIGVQIPIIEGADESALEQGAWRLPQTSTPDQGANTVLTAHRYKYRPPHKETFYLLNKLAEGDSFTVYWQEKKYDYQITSSIIVNPDAIEVLNPTPEPTVTLITCTPLFSTKQRLVISGKLITSP